MDSLSFENEVFAKFSFYAGIVLLKTILMSLWTARYRIPRKDNICMVCGSICKSKSWLNRHLRRHNNAAPYRCCGKMFFVRTKIIMHRCSVHGGEKQKACNICHKKFATEQQVRQHRGLTHGEKGTFRCDICGVEFKSKTSLTDHQHWHTGETAHKCQCGKTYKYASGLYRHKRDKKH